MAIRLRFQLLQKLFEDSSEDTGYFTRDPDDDSVTEDLQLPFSTRRTIPVLSGDVQLNFSPLGTLKFLFLETDKELTIRLNGDATGFTLKPVTNFNDTNQPLRGQFWLLGTSVAQVIVRNNSASDVATLSIIAGGTQS